MGYYDLDEILADGQKIPCRFTISVPGLGYLENNPGKPVIQNTKLDLPLWLAEILAICEIQSEQNDPKEDPDQPTYFIELIQPDFYSSKIINAIKTNALKIDLHQLLPYFYKLSVKWGSMFNDTELMAIVQEMFKQRACAINDYSSDNNHLQLLNSEFGLQLDETERMLFRQCIESHRDLKTWLSS